MEVASIKSKVSKMAENLIGSEIIKLAGEVNAKIKAGEKIFNLTIGDFNSKVFPIPDELKQFIIEAYQNDETNYPPADGILELRNEVVNYLKDRANLEYKADEILIAGGARPLIYAAYLALIDPGDTILFPTPSWNNNHYTHLSTAKMLCVETKPENNFMPTAAELAPHIAKANLLALCSPLNPTGTTFTAEQLSEICVLVLDENKRRKETGEKPLYVLYDQIYWALTFNGIKHVDPVNLFPEMREYTVFIDGLSKAFAATGVRVGWGFGPKLIIDKMKSILGHVGAWAPRAEQVASAKYLADKVAMDTYLAGFKSEINKRLTSLYEGFEKLKAEGLNVNAIAPQAAMYLTVQFNIKGKTSPSGEKINLTSDITKFILDEGKVAIVPFSAFGSDTESNWYRISVGTCKLEDTTAIIENLRTALTKLK